MTSLAKTPFFWIKKGLFSQVRISCTLQKRWQTSQHTLSVKKKIDETRDKAYQAGGQKRIEKQHEKVQIHLVTKLL